MSAALRSVSALALMLAATGCVGGGDETVVILQNQSPDDGCVVPAAPTDEYIGAGAIEVDSPIGYVLAPVVQNYAEATGGDERLRIAFVQGIRVDLAFPDGKVDDATISALEEQNLTRFEIPYAAMISPGGTTSMLVEIVPDEALEELSDVVGPGDEVLVLATVRIVGEVGGSDFTSQSFEYPVTVCRDCLRTNVGACTAVTASTPVNPGGACNPLQDFPVTCCNNSVVGEVCPAEPEDPPQ